MKKVSKILVPVDFSACSQNAIVFALQLADKVKASLLLLTVHTYDGSEWENTAFIVDEIKEQKEQLSLRMMQSVRKAIESIRSTLDEIPSITTDVGLGRVEATICEEAARKKIDFIVMGTQGENSTLDKYLGSIASNVLKNSPCPVMVIPEHSRLEKKLVIGYATDLSDADPFEIWKAMNLFEAFQAEIKCVHFNEKEGDNKEKIKALELYFAQTAPNLNIEIYRFSLQDKLKGMNDFIKEHGINMLVMYKPKRSFFESIFHTSYTQKMAKHTNIPLLVFKQKE